MRDFSTDASRVTVTVKEQRLSAPSLDGLRPLRAKVTVYFSSVSFAVRSRHRWWTSLSVPQLIISQMLPKVLPQWKDLPADSEGLPKYIYFPQIYKQFETKL